jgi:ribosomal 50S subunit-associated protein YjgA (DUF615 family)
MITFGTIIYEQQAAKAIKQLSTTLQRSIREEIGVDRELYTSMLDGWRAKTPAQHRHMQRIYQRLTSDYDVNPLYLFLDPNKPITL